METLEPEEYQELANWVLSGAGGLFPPVSMEMESLSAGLDQEQLASILAWLSGGEAGQNFETLIDGFHGVDLKLAGLHRLNHIAPQHQMFDVGGGNQHTLVPVQPAAVAQVEEAFYFFIDAADGLDFTVLVDRTGI